MAEMRDEEASGGRAGETPALALDAFLPYRLNVLAALTSEGLARLYSERFGVGIPEWRVLAALGESGSMTGGAVGAHSHMHKTKVSRAVASLAGAGLVRREASRVDLREVVLSLTPEGARVYGAIVPLALDYERRLVEGLTPQGREAIEAALSVLTARSRSLLGEIKGGAEPRA